MSKLVHTKTVSTLTLQKYKQEGRKIVCLTAYDYSTAQVLDRAGVDRQVQGERLHREYANFTNLKLAAAAVTSSG